MSIQWGTGMRSEQRGFKSTEGVTTKERRQRARDNNITRTSRGKASSRLIKVHNEIVKRRERGRNDNGCNEDVKKSERDRNEDVTKNCTITQRGRNENVA